MKTSVAIATFNGARFLSEQLQSIARQTVHPDEIVITDDQSDDDTIAVAEQFARTAPFAVNVTRNPSRLGSRANFMRAIPLCSNEVVALCDQDDIWLPRKLELTIQPFKDPDVMAAIHRVTVVDSNLKPVPVDPSWHWDLRGVYHPLTTNPRFSPHGMAMLLRKSLLAWVHPRELYTFDAKTMGHDVWVWFLACALGKIVGIPDRLVLYRQHELNLFGVPRSKLDDFSLARTMTTGAQHYRSLAERPLKYAGALDRVSDEAPEIIKERAKAAAEHYRRVAYYLNNRAALYTSTDRRTRRRLFTEIAFSGGYKKISKGGLGPKAILKDIYVGLLRNRYVA